MRLSRTGLALSSAYTLISALLWIDALFFEKDPKGAFILAQLPVALAHALLFELGLLNALHRLPYIVGYILLFLPTLLVVYCIGWLVGTLASKLMSLGGSR